MDSFKTRYADMIAGLAAIVLGIVGFTASYGVKVAPGAGNISAQVMPRIVSVLVAVLGGLLAVQGLRKYRECAKRAAEAKEQPDAEEQRSLRKEKLLDFAGIAAAIAILALYALLLKEVGFIICTPLLIFAFCMLLAPAWERKPIKFALISLIATAIIYALFYLGFGIMLPMGILR